MTNANKAKIRYPRKKTTYTGIMHFLLIYNDGLSIICLNKLFKLCICRYFDKRNELAEISIK